MSVIETPFREEQEAAARELEEGQVRHLLRLLERSRVELHERLNSLPGERFEAHQTRTTLAQVTEALGILIGRLARDYGDRGVSRALDLGAQQLAETIAHFEPRFRQAWSRIDLEATLELRRGLLLTQYKTSLDRYGLDVIGQMQRRLQLHMVKRSTWREIAIDLAGRLKTQGFKKTYPRAARIVRTEMINALNAGAQAALQASTTVLPDLKRQWDAHLDARTSDICTGLNGQVRALDKPFEHDGQDYAHPPAHPNCRSRLVPFREEWLEHEAHDAA